MDIQESWEKALGNTDIVRSRIKPLMTFEDTELPYIFLSKSLVNNGDTVVRKGKVLVQKPAIVLPHQLPQLFGFDFSELGVTDDSIINFFLLRGIRFPSLKYANEPYALDLIESSLAETKNKFARALQQREDVQTGLILGLDDTWAFSLLIFVASMIERGAENDLRKIFERFKKHS